MFPLLVVRKYYYAATVSGIFGRILPHRRKPWLLPRHRGVLASPLLPRIAVVLSNTDDRWVWDLNGEGSFHVKDARLVESSPYPYQSVHRGVSVSPISCSICHAGLEDLDHLLFCCSMALDVTRSICKWWNLVWVPFVSYLSWLSWFNSIRMPSNSKMVLEGVFYTAWWSIWTYRNQLLFADSHPRKEVIYDDIVRRSFLWCTARRKHSVRWDSWLQHKYLIPL
ncbi:hypothetical protein Tco_0784568 [Tanacetum coccineum]